MLREIISCFAMHLLISEHVCGFTFAKITDFCIIHIINVPYALSFNKLDNY